MKMKRIGMWLSMAVGFLGWPVAGSAGEAGRAPLQAAPGGEAKRLDAKGAWELLQERADVVVLDIRTKKEFKAGHIARAKNIDFYSSDFERELGKLDKSKTYLVHCASGGRSAKSLATFKKLEFLSIYHLDGGIKGWQKAGQPLVE